MSVRMGGFREARGSRCIAKFRQGRTYNFEVNNTLNMEVVLVKSTLQGEEASCAPVLEEVLEAWQNNLLLNVLVSSRDCNGDANPGYVVYIIIVLRNRALADTAWASERELLGKAQWHGWVTRNFVRDIDPLNLRCFRGGRPAWRGTLQCWSLGPRASTLLGCRSAISESAALIVTVEENRG
jgi:hypothetical protein